MRLHPADQGASEHHVLDMLGGMVMLGKTQHNNQGAHNMDTPTGHMWCWTRQPSPLYCNQGPMLVPCGWSMAACDLPSVPPHHPKGTQ
jgi:hypothetical protein